MKTLKIGDKVPAFSGTTHDGAAFSSDSFLGQAYIVFFILKPILLDVQQKPVT